MATGGQPRESCRAREGFGKILSCWRRLTYDGLRMVISDWAGLKGAPVSCGSSLVCSAASGCGFTSQDGAEVLWDVGLWRL